MDEGNWSSKLPTPRSLAIRVGRAFGYLVFGLIIWSTTGIGDQVGNGIHDLTRRIIRTMHPPRVVKEEIGRDENGNMMIRTRKFVDNIQPELKSKNYLAIVIALSLVALFAMQSGQLLAARLAVVAAIAFTFCLLGTLWHAHHVFDLRSQTEGAAYIPTRLEVGLIMACTFYIVPIASTASGMWIIEKLRTSRFIARLRMGSSKNEGSEKPDAPKSRNAQCPCGSGRKYKRCCGA